MEQNENPLQALYDSIRVLASGSSNGLCWQLHSIVTVDALRQSTPGNELSNAEQESISC